MKIKHELTKSQTNCYHYRGWSINVYRELERNGEGKRMTYITHAVVSNWQKVFDGMNPGYDELQFWTNHPTYPVAAQTKLTCTQNYRGSRALKRCLDHAQEIVNGFEDSPSC